MSAGVILLSSIVALMNASEALGYLPSQSIITLVFASSSNALASAACSSCVFTTVTGAKLLAPACIVPSISFPITSLAAPPRISPAVGVATLGLPIPVACAPARINISRTLLPVVIPG